MHCFPGSLATKLGKVYVRKTLEWFLVSENRFLFHIEKDKQVMGYCGGAIPKGYGDGSSSGMLQHAFKEAVTGILKKPWLLFNSEVISFYPFIFKNIKKKLSGSIPAKSKATPQPALQPFKRYTGLVVIGVEPENRGSGVFAALMGYFENEARKRSVLLCNLSVKKDNLRAIHAYKKSGWFIAEEHAKTFVMQKKLD